MKCGFLRLQELIEIDIHVRVMAGLMGLIMS